MSASNHHDPGITIQFITYYEPHLESEWLRHGPMSTFLRRAENLSMFLSLASSPSQSNIGPCWVHNRNDIALWNLNSRNCVTLSGKTCHENPNEENPFIDMICLASATSLSASVSPPGAVFSQRSSPLHHQKNAANKINRVGRPRRSHICRTRAIRNHNHNNHGLLPGTLRKIRHIRLGHNREPDSDRIRARMRLRPRLVGWHRDDGSGQVLRQLVLGDHDGRAVDVGHVDGVSCQGWIVSAFTFKPTLFQPYDGMSAGSWILLKARKV
jgi:hypothetical protein